MPELDEDNELLLFADFSPMEELLETDLAYMTEEELTVYRQALSQRSACAIQMKMSLKDVSSGSSPMVQRAKTRKTGKKELVIDIDF